jgi:hypothetical protein
MAVALDGRCIMIGDYFSAAQMLFWKKYLLDH